MELSFFVSILAAAVRNNIQLTLRKNDSHTKVLGTEKSNCVKMSVNNVNTILETDLTWGHQKGVLFIRESLLFKNMNVYIK